MAGMIGIDAAWPVSSVLLCYPRSLGVFKHFGVDVYRAWSLSLAQAAERDGVVVDELLDALKPNLVEQ